MKIKKFKANQIAVETAEKHNVLTEIMRNQFNQVGGQIQGMYQNFEQVHNRLGALEKDIKLLSFYATKVREENAAIRTLIENNMPMNKFQEVVDSLLKRDFLVDSNNIPVGNLQINEYN